MRAALAARYAEHPKIAVISAEEATTLPPASFDLIVLHSVAQYLSAAQVGEVSQGRNPAEAGTGTEGDHYPGLIAEQVGHIFQFITPDSAIEKT